MLADSCRERSKGSVLHSGHTIALLSMAAKQGGFKSPSGFIRAAIERELAGRESALDETERRIVASLDRFARELRSVRLRQQAEFAFIDALVKTMLTHLTELPRDAYDQAVARGKGAIRAVSEKCWHGNERGFSGSDDGADETCRRGVKMPTSSAFGQLVRRPGTAKSGAWSKALTTVLRYARASKRMVGDLATGGRTGGRSCNQRCAVRVMYSPNKVSGQWRAHGRYIARESVSGDHQTAGLGAAGEGIRRERHWPDGRARVIHVFGR